MEDRQLDHLLDSWRTAPPSMALRDAVLDGASRSGRSSIWPHWLRWPRLWVAGAGLAAGIAGVSCGALLSTAAVREARDEALVSAVVSEGPYAAQNLDMVHAT